MSKYKTLFALVVIFLLGISAHGSSPDSGLDVLSYHLTIEPSIQAGSINGSVIIKFLTGTNADSIVLNCGSLEIDKVSGEQISGFRKAGDKLMVYLSETKGKEKELVIDYHGNPTSGLYFDRNRGLAYTVYATSQWMICHDSPADKAYFRLDLIVPEDKTCVASGELIGRVQKNGKWHFSYQQLYQSPAYTFGFAIGNFNSAGQQAGEVLLKYYSQVHTSGELMDIFRETPAMLSFFQEIAGVKYPQATYSQILVGIYYQEMSGYTILKETYGKLVLQDSTETNLIAHELAHQWWGNRISCKSWNHFWLNEAVATFMSAAYNEYRFGTQLYLANISSYREVYETIKDRGNDKPLVFEDWSNPSRDDRNLVYFKGAYVLHLLREEIGDEVFWEAIKFYTTKYYGRTVETADFQKAIEESSGIELTDFFNKWVYGTGR